MSIYTSPYPDVETPDVSMTEFVLGGAAERGDKAAVIDGPTGAVLTYAELSERVQRTAAGFAASGIAPGDAVGLLGPNSTDWIIAFHALSSAGAIVTSLNPLLTPRELAFQLRIAGARTAVSADALVPALGASELETIHRFSGLPSSDEAPPRQTVDSAKDIAVLPFSSGTTGVSKGVMLSHRNMIANVEQIGSIHRVSDEDTLIGLLPFFHIYGMTILVNLGLSRGATIVTMPRFAMDQFLDLLVDYKVTRAHVAPPVILGLSRYPGIEERDFSLKIVISGAAPLDSATAKRAGERIGAPVRQGYGMTEASPVTHIAADEDAADRDPGSIGFLVGSTEGRIVDPETGQDTDSDGEMWIRGPQVMLGYLGDEEATEATLVEDGWLRTGDVARIDEQGVWWIVDRVKELIKYKGYQVPPAELEALLLSHPDIADAAVIPVLSEEAGEIPKACVVASAETIDGDALMAWVSERVAPYKRIREVEIVDEIPRSASGKILRRMLRG